MRRLPALFAGTALLTCLLVAPAPGQEASSPGTNGLVNIDFPGGTVGEYIDVLRRVQPDLNLVVHGPSAFRVELPPVRLRAVDTHTALHVVQRSFGNVRLRIDEVTGRRGAACFTLTTDTDDRATSHLVSRVIAVDDLLTDTIAAEDLLSAIEAALELLGPDHGTPDIRFHRETRLLLARGHAGQMAAMDQVVSELRRSQSQGRQRSTLEADLKMAKIQTSEATKHVRAMEQEVVKLATALDQRTEESAQRARMLAELEAKFRDESLAYEKVIVKLESMIARLEDKLAGGG